MDYRTLLSATAACITVCINISSLHAEGIERGTNRPGSDYENFSMNSSSSPADCERECILEQACLAWTFVRPGVQGPQPHCWLKNNVPNPIHDNCCASGVPSNLKRALEYNVNRPAGDYTHFTADNDNPLSCADACSQDTQCKAFTYVRPNIQGPRAICWLKNIIPNQTNDGCCISGQFP
jgi:hypothetical protein